MSMTKEELDRATDGTEEVSIVGVDVAIPGEDWTIFCWQPLLVAYEAAMGRKARPGAGISVDNVSKPTKIEVNGKWIKI